MFCISFCLFISPFFVRLSAICNINAYIRGHWPIAVYVIVMYMYLHAESNWLEWYAYGKNGYFSRLKKGI